MVFLKGIEVLELQIMIQTELMDRIRLELEILAIHQHMPSYYLYKGELRDLLQIAGIKIVNHALLFRS